jgi:hypothetical protein
MDYAKLAEGVDALRRNEALSEIIEGIKFDALSIFQNPHSTPEQILEAHKSIQAVGTITDAFDAATAEAKIKNRES